MIGWGMQKIIIPLAQCALYELIEKLLTIFKQIFYVIFRKTSRRTVVGLFLIIQYI